MKNKLPKMLLILAAFTFSSITLAQNIGEYRKFPGLDDAAILYLSYDQHLQDAIVQRQLYMDLFKERADALTSVGFNGLAEVYYRAVDQLKGAIAELQNQRNAFVLYYQVVKAVK